MEKALNVLKTTIHIGLDRPVKFLHITDTHITRDDPHTEEDRTATFGGCAEYYFAQAIEYAKQNELFVLHTGDLIDFLSKGNFEYLDTCFDGVDYIFAAGNHEFCHYVGKAKEDYEYKWNNIKQVAPHIKSNLYFDSRLVGGVNVVTMDDSYYLISDGQLEMLKAEVAKGYPIILGMHVPLYTEKHANIMLNELGTAAVCGAPEQMLATYSEGRRLQQSPDAATLRAIEYIKGEPIIKAVIAGHTHRNFEENITENLPQYLTHGTYAGYVREITVI